MYKNTLKKKGHWGLLLVLMSLILCFSCKDDDGATEYDPSKPVNYERFSPEKGGSTTQLVITGSNFGNDTTLVKVKIGNRMAKVVGVSPTKIYAVVRARSVDESGETPISVTIGENEPYTFEQKFNYELTQMVSTLAGSGAEGQEDSDVPTKATFKDVAYLLIDNDGTIYILEENNSLRKLEASGKVSTVFASTGYRKRAIDFSITGDTMLMARDDNMENPAVHYMLRDDAFGHPRTYMRGVTDQCNTVSVNPIDGYVFWNKFGDGTMYYCPPNNPNAYKKVNGIHSDNSFETYSCWSKDGRTFARIIRNKHIIYKRTYDPVKHEFIGDETLWAGKYEKAEFANGIGEEARFNQPCQGVFDEDGNLYVSDRDNNCIRKITPDGNVTIYAGNRSEGLVNGLPLKSSFRRPEGLTRSKDGVIYVADHDNHVIRKIVVE